VVVFPDIFRKQVGVPLEFPIHRKRWFESRISGRVTGKQVTVNMPTSSQYSAMG